MLRILFFIPAHVDAVDIHHELTTRLAHCLSDSADVRIATSNEKNLAASLANYDILHIFGCWSTSACQLADKAYRLYLPYIITPLGSLQPWEMKHYKHRSIFLRRQKTTVEKASAVTVCGVLEEHTFGQLAWNKRICLIKNPVLTSQTSFEDIAKHFTALYQKVLDSNARILIKQKTQKLIGQLLQFGVDAKAFCHDNSKDTLRADLGKLHDEDWRRVFIYADDEEISDIIRLALDTLQCPYPHLDISEVDRFDTQKTYSSKQLEKDTLLSHNLLLRNKVKEAFTTRGKTEQGVCLQMLNLRYEISRHMAPLRHLVELYMTMRFTDMDEDLVKDMTKELDMRDFTQNLMAVMADLLGLTEGFMPISPKYSHSTKQLSTAITKFQIYKTS